MLAAALGGFLANIYGFKNIICNYVSIIFVWFVYFNASDCQKEEEIIYFVNYISD